MNWNKLYLLRFKSLDLKSQIKKLTFSFLFLITLQSYSQLSNETININGITRTYQMYLPTNFQISEHLPVIYVLHGLGATSNDFTILGFNQIADTARLIIIYPQGLLNSYSQTSWNNGTLLSSTADDISFIQQLMDYVTLSKNTDPKKTYCTGFSMGSIMSHHLACKLNNKIAAIGTMAGTMATSDIASCNPSYLTPVIHLHGTSDPTVPYSGSALPSLSLVGQTMNFWKNKHSCDITSDSTRYTDSANDGITVDRFVYNTCNPNGSVELVRFNNAAHIYLYEPVNDITEAILVWKFLRKWSHPNPEMAKLNELSINDQFKIYPNPTSEKITFYSEKEDQVIITNLHGQVLQKINVSIGENSIVLSDFKQGVYLIKINSNPLSISKIIKE